jgi:hypothetical protein
MEFRVTLQYPNGRTADAVLTWAHTPTEDTEFEMHGRTWRVVGLVDGGRVDNHRRRVDPAAESTRILCVCVA